MTSDGAVSFGYNLRNQLVARAGVTQLYHDPSGRLTQQWNGGGVLDWVGNDLVGETGGSNARRYVHGPNIDEPLVWYEGSGTSNRRWLHADERGSVIAVSDSAGNIVGTRNRYDEYGVPQGSLTGRFGYTGQAFLPAIGLHYYRARICHSGLGRFMQTDPIGYGGGMNIYAYVRNDPVNLTDPLGLDPPAPSSEPPIVVTGRRERFDECDAGLLWDNDPRFRCWISEPEISNQDPGFGDSWTGSGLTLISLVNRGHGFREVNAVCQTRELNQREMSDLNHRFAVPGHAGEYLENGYYTVWAGDLPGGRVLTQFSRGGLTVTNTTTPLHVFVGTITQDIYPFMGRTIMQAYGRGNAGNSWIGIGRDWLNEALGPGAFHNLHVNAAIYAQIAYGGCSR